jgi:peptide/nickel transport system substrate-binding protein
MTFSNGDPLTAEDVIFTFDLIKEKKLSPSSYFGTLDTVKLIDAMTFKLTTKQVDGTVPAAAQFIWVMPKKYYQSVGDDAFLSKPIGSGPYELVEFKPSDVTRFKLRSTPHPFRKPVADELIFRQIPDNASVVAGLLAGELDIAAEVSFSADQANRLKQAGLGLLAPLRGIVYVGVPQGSWETRNTPLKDPKVRQALKYAINTDLIANRLLGGFSKPANQMGMPDTPSYMPDYRGTPYDPATAKRLLAEAGYPNGFTLSGGLDWTPMFTFQDVALAVQADLKAVGIEFQLSNLEYARFVDKAYGRNNLVLADLTIGRAPDVLGVGISRTFIGCGKPAGGTPAVLVYCDPAYDKALDDAYAEADAAKRAAQLKKANQLYTESITAIPLYFEPGYIVYTTKVKGVEPQHPIYYNFDSAYLVK